MPFGRVPILFNPSGGPDASKRSRVRGSCLRKGGVMRLATAIRRFHEGYFSTCERSGKTRAAYQTDLRQFGEFGGRSRSLESLDAESIERWSGALANDGYAPASIRRKMATLRVFFLFWVRRGLLAESPFWKVRLSLGTTRQLPRCLTEAEIRALLRCARRRADWDRPLGRRVDRSFREVRNLALVDLLFATGLRVGEVAALDVADYVGTERSLRVMGKGGRMRIACLADARSVRTQVLHLRMRKRIRTSSGALFLNRFGNRLSSQGIARVVSVLAENASIRRRVTPHMLRHTVATLLLRNGVDIRVVQEFLGHASLATTQRYTHVSKEHLVATLRRKHPSKKLFDD